MSKKDAKNNSMDSIINNTGGFLKLVLFLVILVCLLFFSGGYILFACKLAQSNILPTNIHCKPYSDQDANIAHINSNIFIAKPPKSNEQMSQKIKFPYEKNNKNMLIDLFRGLKESPDSFFLINYFISIFESLLCFNYSTMNILFAFINNFLSESLILIFGPLFLPIVFSIMLIINHIYLMFLWFEKMSWFFKTNVNNTDEGKKPKWENINILNPFGYFIGIVLVFIFFILFFIVGIAVFPLIAIFSIMWVLFSIGNFTGVMEEKEVGVWGIIKKVFKYHKVTFMTILSFLIIISAFSQLGSVGGLICLLATLCMYFRIIPSNIFVPEIPLNLSVLVSNKQAQKTCTIQKTRKQSFLGSLFFPQQDGGELLKQIKQIGGKLNNYKK